MRIAGCALLVVLLAACGGGGDRATTTTKPTPTSTSSTCTPPPTLPPAADGSPAEVVAQTSDVQIAIVDHGASVDVVSLFVSANCELLPLTIDGVPAALPIGGTITHGDGLACTPDGFEVLAASSDDGSTYQATITTYRLDGSELVADGNEGRTIEAEDDPDAISAYYRLDC